jgi:type I restriction enzyme S subunit
MQQVEAMASGSVIRHFGPMHLKQMALPLPPLGEQRAIGNMAKLFAERLRNQSQTNESLEAMARALFKAWFVDFEPVRAKMEGRWQRGQSLPGLPAHLYDLFPDRLVDSEVGDIPVGWEVGKLGELVDTVKGRSYRSEELVDSDTALVTLKSFTRGGGYRPDGLKSFAGTYKAEQVVTPGEVVIACTDVTQAAEVIGRPAIVRGTSGYRRLVASLDTMIVRPRDPRMSRSFLYFLCGTEAFVTHTYAHTTGTTVLHLAKEAVPSFMFAHPAKQLVQSFDAAAAPALERIQALEAESRMLSALRDALLPKLIAGELRVKDAETFLERVAA